MFVAASGASKKGAPFFLMFSAFSADGDSIYDLNQNATNATHSIAAPDLLPAMFYEGTEPISDYTLDKTIKFGVPNHPNLKNVLIFNTSITLPAGITPNDFQFVGYPDHIRFRVDTGSRTLTYEPASPPVETDVTGQQNRTSQGAVIAVSAEDRYAIALYSRQTDVGQYFVQDPHAQFGSHIVLGVGTTPERLLQEQLLLSIATSSSERCTMSKLRW